MQPEKLIIALEGFAADHFRGPLAHVLCQNLQRELENGNVPNELVERATNVLALYKQIGFTSNFLGQSTFPG